jgi:uncharacterized membrane protein
MEPLSEKKITILFRISLIVKVIQGFLEVVLGMLFLYVKSDTIAVLFQEFIRDELAESPYTKTSHFIIQTGNSVVAAGSLFIGLYLLSHGIVKLLLIIGVVKKKLWAYYTFIATLIAFILYQAYRYSITHSPLVLVFTLFDIFFTWLAWQESQIIKRTYY